ncbi:MAG TPA: glycosyltransferase [Pyrinomonadaceae bacterium]|nr:glycosyltransferase [Pyrinomonadaceae bacterium]
MDKAKYDISFVFIGAKRPYLYDFFQERGYEVDFFKFNGRRELPAAIWSLRKILKRINPDIVHTHMVEGSLGGLAAARLLGIKNRLHTRHHSAESHFYYPHGVYYDKIINALSKKIIAISKVVAKVLIEREGVEPEKVVVIPHRFYLETFKADPQIVRELKDTYQLNGHYPVVGVISRFIHWKGIQHIIPAFKKLLENHPQAKLVLANANGPYKEQVHKFLKESLPPENYVTIEFEKNVFGLYGTFDVFVHAPVNEDFEAFGQIYVESLAIGVPSIFTMSGIAHDFIVDKENALVVPYQNSEAITESLELLLQDADLCEKITKRGKEDVWKLFHADQLAGQLDAVYMELLSGSAKYDSQKSRFASELNRRAVNRHDWKTRKPSVSVVISSYNYAHFIGETIQSVLNQTYPAHEIIIVDDGSTDNSAEVIQAFGERVKFVRQQNQGVCVARNRGAEMATGDILAFLDSDDIWLPNKLEKQVAAFLADDEVGIVSCGIRHFDKEGKTIAEYVDGRSGWCDKDILLYREPVLNSTASVIAVRRDIFRRVGGFDEQRELFAAEDRELCYRVGKASKLAFIPEILVDYRIHGKNGHLNILQMERALIKAYEKTFNQADEETRRLERESYGNLFAIIAGSHFHAGDYQSFFRNMSKSLWLTPNNIGQFANFPVRWLNRKKSNQSDDSLG